MLQKVLSASNSVPAIAQTWVQGCCVPDMGTITETNYNYNYEYYLENIELEHIDVEKDLGVYIDKRLKFTFSESLSF